MDKILSTKHLFAIETHDEIQVGPTLIYRLPYLLRIHLRVIHGVVPDGEGRARRAPDEPVGVVRVDEFSRKFSVSSYREVPRAAVRFQCPQIQSSQSLEVEIASREIRAVLDRTSAVNLSEGGRGTWRSHGTKSIVRHIWRYAKRNKVAHHWFIQVIDITKGTTVDAHVLIRGVVRPGGVLGIWRTGWCIRPKVSFMSGNTFFP